MKHNLMEIRKRLGKTQQEIATAAGVSRECYANIETGKRHPSVQTARKLATVMNVSWIDLLVINEGETHEAPHAD